jgi:hypothetical protein
MSSGTVRLGPGMMGYVPNGAGTPVASIDEARRQAAQFADRLGLDVGEVMRFADNYYAELVQPDGGLATEVLVDPESGATWYEYGPAMMWNTRYGMMSGFGGAGMVGGSMMGGLGGPTFAPVPSRTGAPPVSAAEARRIAASWLQRRRPDLSAGPADVFPGYYTLHILAGTRIEGMLSVNAYTGAVWYHWWHGRFLGMEEA